LILSVVPLFRFLCWEQAGLARAEVVFVGAKTDPAHINPVVNTLMDASIG
jgi:hypothetical protein